jgi:hypothetical protein
LWGIGLLSFLYSIWELVGMHRLAPSAFSHGPVVLAFRRDLDHPLLKAPSAKVTLTASGQFRLLSNTECLFSPRTLWRGSLAPTPLPIKGRIRWSGAQAEIVLRAPLGVSVFLCCGLLAMPIPPLLLYVGERAPAAAAALMVFAPVGFVVAVLALCLFVEVRRAQRIVGEIESHLRGRGLTSACT